MNGSQVSGDAQIIQGRKRGCTRARNCGVRTAHRQKPVSSNPLVPVSAEIMDTFLPVPNSRLAVCAAKFGSAASCGTSLDRVSCGFVAAARLKLLSRLRSARNFMRCDDTWRVATPSYLERLQNQYLFAFFHRGIETRERSFHLLA